MFQCDVCSKPFHSKREYDKFYNVGNTNFCKLDCFKKFVESHQNLGFEHHLEERIRPLQPGEMGGDPPVFSHKLQSSFRSGYEAVVAEKMILDWNWRARYESYMIKVSSSKVYIPDFWLPDFGVFIEVKGFWGAGAKKKFVRVQEMFGEYKLILVHAGYRGFFKSDHGGLGDLL